MIKKIKKHTPVSTGGQDGGLSRESISTVVIRDSLESCGHAITIYNDWIFDSNEPHALPLCAASLNFVSCSEDEKTKFKHIEVGYAFCDKPDGKRKKTTKPLKLHVNKKRKLERSSGK